jgi:hypothetical protein
MATTMWLCLEAYFHLVLQNPTIANLERPVRTIIPVIMNTETHNLSVCGIDEHFASLCLRKEGIGMTVLQWPMLNFVLNCSGADGMVADIAEVKCFCSFWPSEVPGSCS